jgi:cell division protein FtsW (lipid II flippase)
MGLIAAGIILNLVGNTSHNQGLAVASLPVIGLGLVLHLAGIVVRGQTIRKNLKR